MNRPLAAALAAFASLGLLGSSGCAPALRVLAGDFDRAPLAIKARATTGSDSAKLALTFNNSGADPIAVDLDRLIVRAASGEAVHVLGKPQRFRGAGAGVRRVPNEMIVVDPHGRAQAELELPSLPERGPLSLQVPSLHRLGIDGQRPLPSLQIPLKIDEVASAEANRFYDPFEE